MQRTPSCSHLQPLGLVCLSALEPRGLADWNAAYQLGQMDTEWR